jgi:hypothetical protein
VARPLKANATPGADRMLLMPENFVNSGADTKSFGCRVELAMDRKFI